MAINSAGGWRASRAVVASTMLLAAAPFAFTDEAYANDQDQFIPDDTHFYMGTGRSIAIVDLFKLAPGFEIPQSMRDEMAGGANVLDELSKFYKEPEKLFANWGIGKDLQFSVYTVGLSPTLRVAITDFDKFQLALDAFEKKHGLTADVKKREKVDVRLYSLDEIGKRDSGEQESGSGVQDSVAGAESSGPAASRLLIATDEKDVILSVLFDTADERHMDSVIGIKKPARSIEQSGELKQLRKEWGYGDELAFFFDLEQIAATLTGTELPAAVQLSTLAALDPQAKAMLEEIRAETCSTEINQMASSWPILVSGYRKFEVTENEVEFSGHAAAVIRHELLRDTLKLFRGVVPASQSGSRPMLSMGVGITVDQLAQAVGQITQLLSSVNYQCSVLASMNRLASADLGGVSMGVVMFGGLARGVRGLSFNMFDVDVDANDSNGPLKSIDSAIAVSVEDPAMLLQTLQMMPQLDMLSELPLDGSEISLNSMLPMSLPPGVELKAAVKGKNIVIYSGEKGTDFANRLGGNDVEVFLHSVVDTALIFGKVESVLEVIGKDAEDAKDIMSMLKAYPRGVLNYSVDFTDEGIELESGGTVVPNQSQ